MTVFCDNGDCCYIDDDGFCGCDKLSIVGGVCSGDARFGRNACDGDMDERLKAENEKLIVKLNAEHIVRQNVEAENAKLLELVSQMYSDMQGVLDMSTDTVFVDSISTLRDMMDCHMRAMAELGMPPADYESRMRELGVETS